MEKKNNFKEIYLKFKELWKNPKTNALMQLGFYAIFFGIFFIMLKFNSNNSEENISPLVDTLSNYSTMNYEYDIQIDLSGSINDSINLSGIKYNDINELENTKTKQKYYINDNNLYDKANNQLITDFIFYINLSSISNENLYNLLKDKTEINKIEYNDKTVKKEYLINNIEFSDVLIESLNIETYEKDNYINKIEIYFVYGENNFNIEMNYTNINNISSYSSN